MSKQLSWSSKEGLFPDLWVEMWGSVWKRGPFGDQGLKITLRVLCFWIPAFSSISKYLLYLCHNIQLYYPSLQSGSGSFSKFFYYTCFMLSRLILEVTVKKAWQFGFDIFRIRPWDIPTSISGDSLCFPSCLHLPSFNSSTWPHFCLSVNVLCLPRVAHLINISNC